MNLKRLARGPILWVVLAVVMILIAFATLRVPSTQAIDTSDGLALLKGGTVEQVRITDGLQRVDMTLTQDFTKDGHDYGKQARPGRKVGHATVCAPAAGQLAARLGGMAQALGREVQVAPVLSELD